MVGWNLFLFSIQEFIQPESVPDESQYCSSKNRSPVFSKMDVMILIEFRYFMETIPLNETAEATERNLPCFILWHVGWKLE
jgi:hypothetical protein